MGSMALHRDIYWVGRQWAVTGYGMQAVDQKLKGNFDIEFSRLWEDGLVESVRAEAWLNAEDFGKALAVARERFAEPLRKPAVPEHKVLGLIETGLNEPSRKATGAKETSVQETIVKETTVKETVVQRSRPAAQKFVMRIERWPAKFVPQWRIRIKR